ncbi:MAG: pantetheine-phosphate adenylyltransferase [Chlamydiales bacterium]|nr:pantetheine-phosphate adenylyltransferase [Chlamydiales bacterium]
MKTAVFPGSFDPPSLGHLDIIKRASVLCDKLYVAVAINVSRTTEIFTGEERVHLLKQITEDIPNVEVISFSGLIVEFAKNTKIDFIIRGLRAFSDFEYEFRMALANRKIGEIETLFLMANAELAYISSTLIRELSFFDKRLHDFIPEKIEPLVSMRLCSNARKHLGHKP